MTALQTTETVYRLFHWKSGTYEFEPGDVEWDRETVTPLRAESVLMEGFRQVDEWPLVRRKITSHGDDLRAAARPRARARRRRGRGPAGEDAFAARRERAASSPRSARNERRVYELAIPGRTVEQIVDLSRLGRVRDLQGAPHAGEPRLPAARSRRRGRAAAAVGAYAQDWQARLRRGAGARRSRPSPSPRRSRRSSCWVDRRGLAAGGAGAVGDNAAQRFLARYQLDRLRGALEVYRLEHGEYPERLAALVDAGLASARDLRYPWAAEYFYRRQPGGRFVLLPPVE